MRPLPTAAELARRLVAGVLAEAPADGSRRVGAILNGLGTTKYEELFVVWRTVARLLRDAGYAVVEPEVGELVTSLDMAGCSLTLVYLDDELERFWTAPADTPAYRKGAHRQESLGADASGPRRHVAGTTEEAEVAVVANDASVAAGGLAVRALAAMQSVIVEAEDELGRIDAVAGDGDHGRGMVKGVSAAYAAATAAADRGHGVQGVLDAAGDAWAAKAGGTSGVLWGAALRAFGDHLGDQAIEAGTIEAADVVAAVRAGLEALQTLGKAKVGDKTMLDSLVPFIDELTGLVGDGTDLAPAWQHAAAVARQAAQDTAQLRPRIGRARPLAERSIGTPDAGAVSMALCLTTVGDVLAEPRSPNDTSQGDSDE